MMEIFDLKNSPKLMQFLYLAALVVMLVVIYLFRYKRKPITKQQAEPKYSALTIRRQPQRERSERRLNVIFQYNGHDFDAYEILGLPAGSQWAAVEVAYEKMVKKFASEPPGSDEIYHHAFNAIRRSIG